ncbi:spore germination protein [Paenibacillus turicensis]|uniref:Spore germination protein n=1 Tax=Paenibacillus turicensis TaxID=160487 RepID=A0ABS4FST8_9BACL|nr:spore germination protein [Paenibacillus turicensis]MBP1905645.1 spore germination protein [Paenibacillus turicensis]
MWKTIISYIPSWQIWAQATAAFLLPTLFYYCYRRVRSFVINKKDYGYQQAHPTSPKPLAGDYNTDLQAVREAIGSNGDVNIRDFIIKGTNIKATLIYIDGMLDPQSISMQVMRMLMYQDQSELDYCSSEELNKYILNKVLPIADVDVITMLDDLNEYVLKGYTALMIEGMPEVLLVGVPSGKTRSISEPVSESLLRGPRLGFTEELSENTSMLRRQGYTEDLEMKKFKVGTRIRKTLVIAYMKGIVNQDLLAEVEKRIKNIDMDFFLDAGYVEQLVEDDVLSPFQQAQNTERPDRVISSLLEGKIAILLDGTPFALIVPVTFSMLLQSPEDYYERWLPASFLRMLRFLCAFISLMAPSLYISFISFHPGLLPTELAITIIETRQGVPFPSLVEVLILEIAIEILREAGIRLPKPIGPAMGIVGGLIIGEAAVQAGIVSPFLVIVVAVTAISSFAIPMYSAGITLRLLRFAGMMFAAPLGMFGTIIFFLFLCSHLTKLESFGVPYVTPFSPFRISDWKDLYIRAPLSLMDNRPDLMKTQNKKRR